MSDASDAMTLTSASASASAFTAYVFPSDGSRPRGLVKWNPGEGNWVSICIGRWADPASEWAFDIVAWFDPKAHIRLEMLNPYYWDGSTRGHVVVEAGLRDRAGNPPDVAVVPFANGGGDAGDQVHMLAKLLSKHAQFAIESNWMRARMARTCGAMEFYS
jgi:hypothetical protein